MLLKSTNTPNVYFTKLDSIVKKVASCEPDLQQSFGITLDPKPVSFTGRVLPTPRQLNGDNRGEFHKPAQTPPTRWSVFCFDLSVSEENLKGFVKQMTDRARYFGLNMGNPNPVVRVAINDTSTIYNCFYNLVKKTQTEFIFVGIPSRKLYYVCLPVQPLLTPFLFLFFQATPHSRHLTSTAS